MARYYFDIYNGSGPVVDDTGLDLPNYEAVRDEAIKVLPDMARDELPNGDDVEFAVKVRDEKGRQIFQATLSLKAGWSD